MDGKIDIKRVAIYSRKSRPDETEDALKRQLQVLVDMAQANSWEWEVFQEVGSSMSMDEAVRPELNKMLRKIQSYDFDGVLVTDADRLSRDMEHSAYMKKMFSNYGVKLITTTKVYDYNSQEDDLMSDMMAIIAKQEYLNIKKRLKRGKKASAMEGKFQGRAPLGYKKNRDSVRLEVDELEAPLVRRIFAMYLAGQSTPEIARVLELEGTRSPNGAVYMKSHVGKILNSEVYIGTAIYGKCMVSKTEMTPSGSLRRIKNDTENQIRVENAHEPIISLEDWDAVHKIRKSRASIPIAGRIAKNPFSNLITCAICGKGHTFQRNRKDLTIRVSSCETPTYHKDGTYTLCANQSCKFEILKEGIYEELSKYVERLKDHLDQIRSKTDKNAPYSPDADIKKCQAEITKLETQIKKTSQAFILDMMDESEAQLQIKQRKQKIGELQVKIEKLQNMQEEDSIKPLEVFIARLESILNGTSDMESRDLNTLFKSFIEKIEYRRLGRKKGDFKAPIEIHIYYKTL
ncbi:MAG: recombinase family protein [Turicibacter sp.]|nr:recombinase family protein [Turicibacter sp.]